MDENILFRNFSSDVLEGARMYLIALGSMGVLGLAGAMYIAETMRDRILLIVGFPPLSWQSRHCSSDDCDGWFG